MTLSGQSKVVFKTDNNFVYLADGIRLVKLAIPSMAPQFVIETEH